MKRIFPAIILALLFHVVLLRSDVAWLSDKKIDTKTPPVMITMSYRKVEPAPKSKKPPEIVKKKEKREIEKPVKKIVPVLPEKLIEVPVTAKPAVDEIIQENYNSSVDEETQESIDENVPEPEKNIIVHEAFPFYRANPAPEYPRIARKRGYEGTVVLSMLVNEDGQVDNLWVFESSGYKVLDNAAIEAVREWIFEPGRRGDRKIEMWVQIPVMFELE